MTFKKKILVLEENVQDKKILLDILDKDFLIFIATDIQNLQEIVNKQYDDFSAIILDISIQLDQKYDFLCTMNKNNQLSKIPVLVTSSTSDTHLEKKVLELGVQNYIIKPYESEIFKLKLLNTITICENNEFSHMITYDSLTKLYTKEYFYKYAEKIIKENSSVEFDIICCDIMRFKLVNEFYGINEGNSLLCFVAGMLRRDTKNKGICCRINKDIFALLIPRPVKYLKAHFDSSAKYIKDFNHNLNNILKYGIYQIQDRTIPVNIMCDRAYLALESIKDKYDTLYVFYNEKIRQRLLNEQFISLNMENALLNEEFHVYLQSKHDLVTGELTSAEALVRWVHPKKGIISPTEFIPILEKNGFITKLDVFIWEKVCKTIREWIDNGIKPIPISVNISRADIYNPNIDQILMNIVNKYNVLPQFLYLEITETAYIENEQDLILTLKKLKKLGFIIAMDDFGSGYSSLNMLSELPIDVLKLDIRFIQGNHFTKNRRDIISFIISLARWFNMHIIAEGIETIEQVNLLRSLGCERGQGYYFSKPLSIPDFTEFVSSSLNNKNLVKQTTNKKNTLVYNKHDSILILDETRLEINTLKQVFKKLYTTLSFTTADEMINYISSHDSTISSVIVNVLENTTINLISKIVYQCNLYDIPVLTIHHSGHLITKCISKGVSDCIVSPYSSISLPNRVRNAICEKKVSKFVKQKEFKSAILDMKERAEKDTLTNLLNRTEFEARVHKFFSHNKQPEGIFIILDIDHFKNINDSLGHISGDKILCFVAELLIEIFPETNIISRLGGDEFALFIPYKLEQFELEKKLLKICQTFSANESTKVSCSVGVCFSPIHGFSYKELYKNSDIALLNAKQLGKSQYVIFEHGLTLPSFSQLEQKATALLNDVSDAMFVCDATSNEIIYINNTACHFIDKNKYECIGAKCYQLFWDKCKNCDRCLSINQLNSYYEEDTVMKDGKTSVHIKAKLGKWDGKDVKIHYLQGISDINK